jgi:DNA polymerase-4
MLRNILHFRIDAFPAAVERIKNPSLRHRPVAVCPRHSPRSVIFSASAEARREGVFEGMPLVRALQRCRALVVLPPDEPLYRRASDAVAKVLGRYSPFVEPGLWGRFYADLSGTGRLFGGVPNAAFRILRDVEDSVRFNGTLGLASNKLVSGVAARVVRSCGDLCEVPSGSEASFLAPLRVRMLPAVRSKMERELLSEFNIRFVEQLAGIPVHQLVLVFGRFGLALHRQSLGVDETPVHTQDAKPFVLEEETLAEDTNDDAVLLSVLYGMTERACRTLRAKNVLPRTVWLHVRYSDGVDATRRLQVQNPSAADPVLFRILEPFFLKTNFRRQRVRYFSLTLTDLAAPPAQLSLFDVPKEHPREERLVRAVEAVRGRYGKAFLQFGRTWNQNGSPRMLTD